MKVIFPAITLIMVLFLCFLGVNCTAGTGTTYTTTFTDASTDNYIPSITDSGSSTDQDTGLNFDLWNNSGDFVTYHGGQVMTLPVNVYLIWYGDWSNNTTVSIINDLVNNFSSTDYYTINEQYVQNYDAPVTGDDGMRLKDDAGYYIDGGSPSRLRVSKNPILDASLVTDSGNSYPGFDAATAQQPVTSKLSVAQNFFVSYSRGSQIYDNDILWIIHDTVIQNSLQIDPNAIYVVLTSADVTENPDSLYSQGYGFCNIYCAWHYFGTLNNERIKFTFVGDPTTQCLDNCSVQSEYLDAGFDHSPNNNWGADAISSALIHEISEILTDPYVDSWYSDQTYSETMDICAWQYGPLYITNNNSVANVKVGNRDFLLQENLNMFGQYCTMRPGLYQ